MWSIFMNETELTHCGEQVKTAQSADDTVHLWKARSFSSRLLESGIKRWRHVYRCFYKNKQKEYSVHITFHCCHQCCLWHGGGKGRNPVKFMHLLSNPVSILSVLVNKMSLPEAPAVKLCNVTMSLNHRNEDTLKSSSYFQIWLL